MKTAVWYTLRELRRRPRRWISMTLVSAAVMAVMVLMVLWSEAQWRSEVMPDNPYNYHFTLYSLTESEKKQIRNAEWCQASYDIYNHYDSGNGYENPFRVRVTWDHVADVLSIASNVMLQLNLYEREPYASRYESEYNVQYEKLKKRLPIATAADEAQLAHDAAINARSYVIRYQVKHTSFINKTQNSYIMQPQFFLRLCMSALFLGGAMMLLMLEIYRSAFPDLGTLRALGMNRLSLCLVPMTESLAVALMATVPASLISVIAVRIFGAISAPYRGQAPDAFFTITDYIPVTVLIFVAVYLIGAAVIGTLAVCFIYRDKQILSLLRAEGTFRVTFVSRSSDRFENADGDTGYARLYDRRARGTLLRYTLVTAILLPFPMTYIQLAVMMCTTMETPADVLQGIYHIFQAIMILLTTVVITFFAGMMETRQRTKELGMLRALGADRPFIRRVVFSSAAVQTLLMLLLAVLFNAFLTDSITGTTYVGSKEGAVPLGQVIAMGLFYFGSALFVLPSTLGAPAVILHGFFRRPIIQSLRAHE